MLLMLAISTEASALIMAYSSVEHAPQYLLYNYTEKELLLQVVYIVHTMC